MGWIPPRAPASPAKPPDQPVASTCPGCGAPIGRAAVCEYCGRLVRSPSPPTWLAGYRGAVNADPIPPPPTEPIRS